MNATSGTRSQLALAAHAAEDKKAENIAILQMDKSSSAFTDYFLIASGTNPKQVQAIADACKAERGDCLVLCHGGPIAEPADAKYVLERCQGVEGFYGASSMERLPAERAITEQVRHFTGMTIRR